MCIWGQILACILLTELVPRIWRLGLSDFSSLRTISRKLSTNRLMLWQWQAISSWSRASMAMHTYLNRKSTRPHIDLDKLCQPNCGCWYRFRLDNENAHSHKFINNESETSLYSCSKPKRWGSGERMNKIQKWNNRICQGRWHVEKKCSFLSTLTGNRLPVSVSSHIPRQSLRQVGSDTVEFLRSWQGVECQLFHVGLDKPILQRGQRERTVKMWQTKEMFGLLVSSSAS